jgi:hypothetical protein
MMSLTPALGQEALIEAIGVFGLTGFVRDRLERFWNIFGREYFRILVFEG